MPFSVMNYMGVLQCDNMHQLVDVDAVLGACKTVQQLARMNANNGDKSGNEALQNLKAWMDEREMVTSATLFNTLSRS